MFRLVTKQQFCFQNVFINVCLQKCTKVHEKSINIPCQEKIVNELISENKLFTSLFCMIHPSIVLEFLLRGLIVLLFQGKAMFSISHFERFPGRRITSNSILKALQMTLCAGYEVTSVTKNMQVVFPKYYPIAIIKRLFITGYPIQ